MNGFKKLSTVFYALMPFIFGVLQTALQTQGLAIGGFNQLIQGSNHQASLDSTNNGLERVDLQDNNYMPNTNKDIFRITESINPEGLHENGTKDRAPRDTSMDEQETEALTEDDQDKAAKLGMPVKDFKSVRDLLLNTTGIDIGTKSSNTTDAFVEENFAEDEVKDREERSSNDCPESPPDVDGKCIPCASDWSITFEHTDDNEYKCTCDICKKPTYMSKPCTCSPDGRVHEEPTCTFPKTGEYFMPYKNWCSKPFPCTKTCPDDMVIVKNCTVRTDAVCGCPDGMDQTDDTCIPIQLCNEGSESVLDGSSGGASLHVCQPCKEGFIQPSNKTLDKCLPPPIEVKLPEDKDDFTSPKPNNNELTTAEIPNDSTDGIDFQRTSVAEVSTDNGSKYPCTCTESTVDTTPTGNPDSIVPKLNRLLDPISLTVVWIFTILIAVTFGVFIAPYIQQLRERCSCCNGRAHQAPVNAHYSGINDHVALDIDQNQSSKPHHEVTFSPKTGRTGNRLRGRGRGRKNRHQTI